MIEIAPSILSADFARLADDVARVERAGVTILHVDVMDGHFVPNITIGPPVVESLRKVTRLQLDVHLMIENPERFVAAFVGAGANAVSVHYEACRHLDGTLGLIRKAGALAGVVLNPATPVSVLEDVLEVADYGALDEREPRLRRADADSLRARQGPPARPYAAGEEVGVAHRNRWRRKPAEPCRSGSLRV